MKWSQEAGVGEYLSREDPPGGDGGRQQRPQEQRGGRGQGGAGRDTPPPPPPPRATAAERSLVDPTFQKLVQWPRSWSISNACSCFRVPVVATLPTNEAPMGIVTVGTPSASPLIFVRIPAGVFHFFLTLPHYVRPLIRPLSSSRSTALALFSIPSPPLFHLSILPSFHPSPRLPSVYAPRFRLRHHATQRGAAPPRVPVSQVVGGSCQG